MNQQQHIAIHLALGQKAENLAKEHLIHAGLKFITANFICKTGEIDLIMQERTCIVFVEVRYRKNQNFGGALESITPQKQKKIIKAAQYFLIKKKLYDKILCRFDAVIINQQNKKFHIEWIKNAFQMR